MLEPFKSYALFTLLVFIIITSMARYAEGDKLRIRVLPVMMDMSSVQIDNIGCPLPAGPGCELLDVAMFTLPVRSLFTGSGQLFPVERIESPFLAGHGCNSLLE